MTRFQLWSTAAVTASLMLGLGLIAPLLPVLRDELSLSGTELGLLVAAFPAARVGFAFAAGLAVDRFGLRRLGVLSCLVSAASAAAVLVSLTPGALIALLFGMGLGSVFYSAAAVAHVLEANARGTGRALGSYQTVTLVGGALGPVLGALAGTYLDLRAPFLIYAALCCAGAVVTWFVIEEPDRSVGHGANGGQPMPVLDSGTPARRVHAIVALVAVAVFASRQGHVTTLVPLIAFDDLGLSVQVIGWALAASVLATVVVVPLAGRLADAGKNRSMLIWFMAAIGLCLPVILWTPSAALLLATLIVYGGCTAFLLIAPQVLLAEWSAPGRRGRAIGVQRTASALGMVVGPFLAGVAVEAGLIDVFFLGGAAVLLLTAVVATTLPRVPPLYAEQASVHTPPHHHPEGTPEMAQDRQPRVEPQTTPVDVLVVGGGNAGFCAAHAARESGASVLVLEKGTEEESGGNSYYTASAFRVVHGGIPAIEPYVDDETRAKLPETVLAPYSAEDFLADMRRVTEGRGDEHMARLVSECSEDLVPWLAGKGIRWRLMYERQAYESDGQHVFWGGVALGVVDGGKGLMRQHTETAVRSGVDVRYGVTVLDLVRDSEGRVVGVDARVYGEPVRFHARSVVLAAGGFESNPQARARHLGPEWAQAYVRGTPLNTGEVLETALAAGAAPWGDWSTCHSVAWDTAAPQDGGDRHLTNQRTRQSYPLGIVVNVKGERFLDEGADFRNYTYAKYGAEILRQPEGKAFQIFDAKTRPLLRAEEYDSDDVTEVQAGSVQELARLIAVDEDALRSTIERFNASILDVPFDPAVKDGRAADVEPPKSNWALAIDSPPYYAFSVGCGVTFTFGGLHVNDDAEVLDTSDGPIPGLFAAGEIVGGLFSYNYPGGSGLTAGAVYGRIAGASAARAALGDGRAERLPDDLR